MFSLLLAIILVFVPLYPKFPLVGVTGTFVAIRLEDFVLAGIYGIWMIKALKSRFKTLNQPVNLAIITYWFISAIASFIAITLTKSISPNLGILHTFRRIEYMLGFLVAYDFLQNTFQLRGLIQSFLITSFLVGIYGIGQQIAGFPVVSTTNSEFAKGLALTLGPAARINSTFAGHYDLAAFSVFPLLLCLGLITLKLRHRWTILLVAAPIYIALLLSASRVTFAGFFIAAGLLLLLARKKFWLLPLTLLALVSVILSPQLAGRYRELILNHLSLVTVAHAQTEPVDSVVPDALKPTQVAEDRSFNIRLQAEWPRALRSFEKNPLVGTGFSSIGLAADNDYLRLLAETGIFGFSAFLLVIIRCLKPLLFYLKRPPQTVDQIIVVSILLGLVSLLINGIFIDVFEASKVAIICWTLVGLAHKAHTWQLNVK